MRARDTLRGAAAPLALGALAGSLVAARIETAVLCIVVAAALARSAGATWPAARTLRLLATGALVSVALNLYLVQGTPLPLPELFGRPATREGLVAGILLALRVLGAALAVHALRALWPGERAADEIAARLAPLQRIGVPVGEARTVTGLALRFVPVLGAEAARIGALQELRAGRPPRTWRERITRQRARLVPVMSAALERAERVAFALEARHVRTRPLPATRSPWLARIAGLALALVALLWRG